MERLIRSLVSTLLLLWALVNAQSGTTSAPIADLGYVKYRGYTNDTAGINYFRGIHYAANPSGQFRWQKPRPIETNNDFDSNSVHSATVIQPACYQAYPEALYWMSRQAFLQTPQGQSEDCLTLDILVPVHPTSPLLPVVVQIHGGGFTGGFATMYPGDALVNASDGNLIYVSIQYRLGIFGFLAGGQIAKNGVLNAGLLDQRAALDWIQRNIRAFGGDPSKVTIWGGSAGGSSVSAQLIAGGAYDQPPFSAAISEYPWWQPFLNTSQQELGLFTTYRLSNCSSVTCLRALPSSTLASLNQRVLNETFPGPGAGYGSFFYGPVVDSKFIKELPGTAFSRGNFYDVPLLVDRNAYEGYIFSNRTQQSQADETTDARDLFPFAGPAFFSRLYQLYPRSAYNSTFYQRQTWFGDFIINCPTYQIASNAVDRNSNSSAVFKLVFAAGNQLHGATSPFLTSSVTGWPSANNHTLAEIMSAYWISFALTHDPNVLRSPSAPFWPSYVSGGRGTVADGESAGLQTLSVTYSSIEAVRDPDASAQCDFFASHGYQVQN